MKLQPYPNTLHEPRTIDGDTVQCWMDLSYSVRLLVSIRLKGIEGGELGTEAGERAKLLCAQILARHWLPGTYLLGNPRDRDNHGRIVADIQFPSGTTLVAELLRTGDYALRSARRPS